MLNDGFVVIFVNRLRHTISCCTTRGDKINNYIWNDLCELKDNGKYFVCCAYRYKCKENDDPFVLYLADFFTNGKDNVISSIPSDEEIIQMYGINVNGEVDQTSTNALQYKPRTFKNKKFIKVNQPSINPVFESEEEKHYKKMSDQFHNNENFRYNYDKHKQIRKAGMTYDNYNKVKQEERLLQATTEQNPPKYIKFNQPSINPVFESEEEKHYKKMSDQFHNNENFRYNYDKHKQIRKAGMTYDNYNKLKQEERMFQTRTEQNPKNKNYRDMYNTFRDFRETRMRNFRR